MAIFRMNGWEVGTGLQSPRQRAFLRSENLSKLINVSVRMPPKTVEALNKSTALHKATQAKLVQRLIEYFGRQSRELQNAILSGVHSNEIDRIGQSLNLSGRTLLLSEWGEYALSRGYIPWAIEVFSRLDSVSAGSEGLQRLARYKLALSWYRFGLELRSEAIAKAVDSQVTPLNLYSAAGRSLAVAIAYFRGAELATLEDVGSHPFHLYNEACCWSLIAQYSMEESLPTQELAKLSRVSTQESLPEEGAGEGHLLGPIAVKKSVRTALENALHSLARIRIEGSKREMDGLPTTQTRWAIKRATGDPDLAMLRGHLRDEFNSWLSTRNPMSSLLESYEECLKLVSVEVPEIS
jgi:hypothetical protein